MKVTTNGFQLDSGELTELFVTNPVLYFEHINKELERIRKRLEDAGKELNEIL